MDIELEQRVKFPTTITTLFNLIWICHLLSLIDDQLLENFFIYSHQLQILIDFLQNDNVTEQDLSNIEQIADVLHNVECFDDSDTDDESLTDLLNNFIININDNNNNDNRSWEDTGNTRLTNNPLTGETSLTDNSLTDNSLTDNPLTDHEQYINDIPSDKYQEPYNTFDNTFDYNSDYKSAFYKVFDSFDGFDHLDSNIHPDYVNMVFPSPDKNQINNNKEQRKSKALSQIQKGKRRYLSLFIQTLIKTYTEFRLNEIADLDLLSGLTSLTKQVHGIDNGIDYDDDEYDDDEYDDPNNGDVGDDRNYDKNYLTGLTADQQIYNQISNYTMIRSKLHAAYPELDLD